MEDVIMVSFPQQGHLPLARCMKVGVHSVAFGLIIF